MVQLLAFLLLSFHELNESFGVDRGKPALDLNDGFGIVLSPALLNRFNLDLKRLIFA